MAFQANRDVLEKIDHLIVSLEEAVEFAKSTGREDHNAGMWNAAIREMVKLLEKRGETWDVVEIRDS